MPPERKLRTMIVDDEAMARQRLARLLGTEPAIELVAECADGPEAIRVLLTEAIDLLFLDVQMPEMDGFAVLAAVPAERRPVVVMVTAYDRYAIQAFEASALDYLLKPFHRARFAQALERARAQVELRATARAARQAAAPSPREPHVAIRTGRNVVLLLPGEIDWVEAAGNYVCVHCPGTTHVARETLASLFQRLGCGSFTRIHRSVIVNTARVREIRPMPNGDHAVLLQDGTRLVASRTFREGVEGLVTGVGGR
jgi:two-component system, LytTR family, response regulator